MTDKLEALKASARGIARLLGDIASFDSWDIDGDIVDIRFEDENGCDTGADVSITETADKASQAISELLAALEEQNMKLFDQSILLDAAISRAEASGRREEHLKATVDVLSAKNAELQQRLQQPALADVMAERQRQIDAEGWTPQHDDEHTGGEIADAAACYARLGAGWSVWGVLRWWPWEKDWLKPSEPRRSLVKAGALILTEIERLDRAVAKVEGE